jgi:sporulation-control protein spo0M
VKLNVALTFAGLSIVHVRCSFYKEYPFVQIFEKMNSNNSYKAHLDLIFTCDREGPLDRRIGANTDKVNSYGLFLLSRPLIKGK